MFKPTNSIKINRLQIGDGAPAAGANQLSVKDKAAIGATFPSGWGTVFSAHLLGTGAAVAGSADTSILVQNLYHDGTNYKRSLLGAASYYKQYNGTHTWYVAISAAAGSTPTFLTAAVIDITGKLTTYYGIQTTALTATTVTGTTLTDGTLSSTAGIVTGIVSLNGLLDAEITQLKNIDTTAISATQWGYLGAMNQSVASSANVSFNQISGTIQTAIQGNITSLGTLAAITVTGTATFNSGTNIPTGQTYKINNAAITAVGLGGEAAISAGTSAQYWRGDKSWQTLNTLAVAELTNLYYTDARARAAISATSPIAYSSSTGAITHVDTASIRHVTDTEKSTWNAKQAALISATNIKTVNSTTLLGSGDVVTVSSLTAGSGMNFTTISSTGAITMGTPSTLTTSTSNGVSANSHTHAITGFLPVLAVADVDLGAYSLLMGSTSYFYIGSATVDGSWRLGRSGNNLTIERRESSAWVAKSTVLA